MLENYFNAKAYAAGIIDGEGCILIAVRPPRDGRSAAHDLRVIVKMRDHQAIELLRDLFGGVQKYRVIQGGKVHHQWQVQQRKAYRTLKDVLPYLLVKKAQAEMAIRFYEDCIGRPRPGLGGGDRKLQPSEIALRDSYKNRLSAMKKENYIDLPEVK